MNSFSRASIRTMIAVSSLMISKTSVLLRLFLWPLRLWAGGSLCLPAAFCCIVMSVAAAYERPGREGILRL